MFYKKHREHRWIISTLCRSELIEVGNILCVILHYGSEEDTNRCVESLQLEDGLDIVISDNDPKQTYSLPREYAKNARIIKTGGSAGFSEGNNIAANAFLSDEHDAVFILNNDTVVQEGAITLMKEALQGEGVGAVGPCMPFADMPNKIWSCGGYINQKTLSIGAMQPKSGDAYEVDYLPGAAFLTRADLWKAIGGLSEKYFLAYEEAEYALEIKRMGYRSIVVTNATIFHKVGMSGKIRPEYLYNSVRNRIIFSKYLHGNIIGFLYAALITLSSVRPRKEIAFLSRCHLWVEAVFDEFKGKSIDRQRLSEINMRFKSN